MAILVKGDKKNLKKGHKICRGDKVDSMHFLIWYEGKCYFIGHNDQLLAATDGKVKKFN
jgi:hypothetical protein